MVYGICGVSFPFTEGAKLVSLNEKQRGFPTGVRFMKDTTYKECILVIDPTLNTATYNGSIPLDIQHVEVRRQREN